MNGIQMKDHGRSCLRQKAGRLLSAILMALLAIQLLSTAGGCRLWQKKKAEAVPNIGSHLRQSSQPIRRVVVLPMESRFSERESAVMLQNSIVESLRQRGAFEVIEASQQLLGPCSTTVIADGIYDEQQLVWLMRRFNADAVMYSRLHHARPVAPQQMGVICHLVDAREAYVVATVEGAWDLSLPADKGRFEEYVRINDLNFLDPELASHSPRALAAFAGDEIAGEIYR